MSEHHDVKNSEHNTKSVLKMVDLCAGTGAFSLGFEQTGCVETVFANDVDKNSEIIYNENFNHKLNCSDLCNIDVKDIPEHDILTAGFPCFVAGTLVLTENGYKNIEDVQLDDKLLTHNNKFEPIVNIQRKKYNNKLINLMTKYHPTVIKCTEDHPFYVRKKMIVKKEYILQNPEWKKACELNKDYYLGMVINNKNNIPEFKFEGKNLILNKNEMWFMLGYFINNGKVIHNKNIVKFDIFENTEIYNRINNIIHFQNGYESGDICWFNILNQFGKYNTIIPEWVQDAPKMFIKEFLNGYEFNGTNKYGEKFIGLLYSIQRLYLKLGIFMSIKKLETDKYCLTAVEKHDDILFENNYIWCQLDNIKIDESNNINVYNFEVLNDNSYIVENVIVHNCQPFSIAGSQKGFSDPRSNIFWKILEIINYHKPACVIFENVKNLEKHDNGKTFEIIKDSIIKENYYIHYKILNTSKITHIPQNRERIYIICFKDEKIHSSFDFNFDKVTKLKIQQILQTEEIPNKYYYDNKSNNIHSIVSQNVINENTVYQYRRYYVRENKNNECPTLTANMGTGGHNVPLILDERGARKLTPRECFNFQGFPQTYILPKIADSKLYKLAGNAVTLPVVQLIANKLVPLLYNNI